MEQVLSEIVNYIRFYDSTRGSKSLNLWGLDVLFPPPPVSHDITAVTLYHYEYFATPPCFSFSTPFVSLVFSLFFSVSSRFLDVIRHISTFCPLLSVQVWLGAACISSFYLPQPFFFLFHPVFISLSFCTSKFFFLLLVAWWQMPNWMMNVPLFLCNWTASFLIGLEDAPPHRTPVYFAPPPPHTHSSPASSTSSCSRWGLLPAWASVDVCQVFPSICLITSSPCLFGGPVINYAKPLLFWQ